MRLGLSIFAAAALFATASAPAQAGLVNATSTVNPFFDFVQPPATPLVGPSTVFNTGAPARFHSQLP